MTRKKQLLFIGVCFALILLIVAAVIFIKKPNVHIASSPSKANIIVDQTKTETSSDFYLKPGKHTLKASFNGFSDQVVDFTVKSIGVTQLSFILTPNSQAGIDYLANHPEEQNIRQGISGSDFHNETTQREDTTPLIKNLPYMNNDYEVSYGQSVKNPDSNNVAIYITIYQKYGKQEALDWITSMGYDPSRLEIVYKDLTNSQN